MNQTELNLNILEQKLKELVGAFGDIREEKENLELEVSKLKENLKTLRSEMIEMKDENDRLKVANALLGNEEHRRLMKIKVNKLIRELDGCISQIKYS